MDIPNTIDINIIYNKYYSIIRLQNNIYYFHFVIICTIFIVAPEL